MDADKKKKLLLLMVEDIFVADEYMWMTRKRKRNDVLKMYRNRSQEGAFNILIQTHLLVDNDTKFQQYFRLTPFLFDYVLGFIKTELTKQSSNRVRNPITAEQKLAVTLRYLATGESFRSLSFQFRISFSYVSVITRECMEVLSTKMLLIAMPTPTLEKYQQIAEHNFRRWNFPNCVGAIDGKHVRIKCPNKSSSLYFNYKGFFSIVMLAVSDGHMKFVSLDVGAYGREGDAGIFNRSNLGKQIINETCNFPPPAVLPGSTNITIPHVIVGDSAFALRRNLMIPFTQRIANVEADKRKYNYHLSRCRRTVEKVFGIMCQYFRIFFTTIETQPTTIDKIIISCAILHNLLRDSNITYAGESPSANDNLPMPPIFMPLIPVQQSQRGRWNAEGTLVRNKFISYFNNLNDNANI